MILLVHKRGSNKRRVWDMNIVQFHHRSIITILPYLTLVLHSPENEMVYAIGHVPKPKIFVHEVSMTIDPINEPMSSIGSSYCLAGGLAGKASLEDDMSYEKNGVLISLFECHVNSKFQMSTASILILTVFP